MQCRKPKERIRKPQEEDLVLEKERYKRKHCENYIQQLNVKITEAERAKTHAEEMLLAEQEKTSLLQQECVSLREARENLDKKLDQMQRRLHREHDEWFQREQELLQRIEEVKILQIERTKNEEQGKLAEEIMEQYQAATTKIKKLELDLDAALREKQSMEVEIGILEAKVENAQPVLEASDLQYAMEKQKTSMITPTVLVLENDRCSKDNIQRSHLRNRLSRLLGDHRRIFEAD